MLPYLAQGANSSLEDGAVLGGILGHLESKAQLPEAIKLYQSVRKNRSEMIVRETFHQRNAFHMKDGPEQEERDRLFASQLGKPVSVKFPSRWYVHDSVLYWGGLLTTVAGHVPRSNHGCMATTPTKRPMPRWPRSPFESLRLPAQGPFPYQSRNPYLYL